MNAHDFLQEEVIPRFVDAVVQKRRKSAWLCLWGDDRSRFHMLTLIRDSELQYVVSAGACRLPGPNSTHCSLGDLFRNRDELIAAIVKFVSTEFAEAECVEVRLVASDHGCRPNLPALVGDSRHGVLVSTLDQNRCDQVAYA